MAADERPPPRFLTLADVAEVLNTSTVQVTALIRRRELKALQIGARKQWRVEVGELEAYIQRAYEQTDQRLRAPEGPNPDRPLSPVQE